MRLGSELLAIIISYYVLISVIGLPWWGIALIFIANFMLNGIKRV